jgi:enoyl-[acyl-carrier protein] reductase I
LDVVVHSIDYAPREALEGRFTDVTTRESWRITMDVLAYSLIDLARAFRPMMKPGSCIVTLSYSGAEKVVTNYNGMGVARAPLGASVRRLAEDLGCEGIRVNAISTGPLKPLAAAGIKGLRTALGENASRTSLRRNIGHAEVGSAGLFLCSAMGSGITGETFHVDAGQNIMGVNRWADRDRCGPGPGASAAPEPRPPPGGQGGAGKGRRGPSGQSCFSPRDTSQWREMGVTWSRTSKVPFVGVPTA